MMPVTVKISKFFKEREANELLSSLGIRTPFSKIPIVGPLCFNSIKEVIQSIKWMK